MRIKWEILVVIVSISGCVPLAPDEFNTKLWMSTEERIEGFKRQLDYEIGREFYSLKTRDQICKRQKCNHISDVVTEYIFVQLSETNPPRKCEYAWLVDLSQSKGNYQYKNGPLHLGLGKKIEWRYISNPDQCLETIGFSGPW